MRLAFSLSFACILIVSQTYSAAFCEKNGVRNDIQAVVIWGQLSSVTVYPQNNEYSYTILCILLHNERKGNGVMWLA